MSEYDLRKRQRHAEDYADDDRDAAKPEPYEQTYRDGSLKNECWRGDDES